MNVSSVTKHFPTANKGFITTLGSTISGGAATVPLTSVSGLNNGDVFVGIIEPGDPNEQEFTGTVDTAGVQITGVKWTDGTNVDHTAGVTIVDYVSATGQNIQTKGILEEHNQDGTHSDITADSVTASGTITAANFVQSGGADSAGWTVGLPAVSSVTALGNRSYDIEFASDVSDTLSEGMRLRTTRTVASTQNAFSLDGSNDYYNKTSPSGMTFTDDFSVSAWVYLTSYGATSVIASRYNGTSGWRFLINGDGTVLLTGHNAGSGNYRRVVSYQSIPLNKWVHVAAQEDMSTNTATTTTCYVMIDGVNVPAQVVSAGSNPTALAQAGNLEIGSENGGSSPFPGYLDQVAIYSAKVTQATHLAAMHQGLTGSETSLISAYANGSTTDLSATGNNLTAQNGATTVASSPFGNRGASTTLDYGLVMSVSTTNVTVQVPEGCTIPTSGGITSVSYSTQANPFGWISDKGRWYLCSRLRTLSATTSNATYGSFIGGGYKLNVQVGKWIVGQKSGGYYAQNVDTFFSVSPVALTGLNASAAAALTPLTVRIQAPSAGVMVIPGEAYKDFAVTTATDFTMYTFGPTTSSGISGDVSLTEIYAIPSNL